MRLFDTSAPWLLVALPTTLVCCFLNGSAVDGGVVVVGSDSGAPDASDPFAPSWEQRVMHRLTRVEYANTVRDLLGEPASVSDLLPDDQQNALGYDNDGVALVTSSLLVEQYFNVAGQLTANLFGRLHPYAQAFVVVSEPNYGVPCTGLSFGQICGNDNFAWYNGDPNTGFWGIRPSQATTPNDLFADQIAITLDGIYTLSLTAFATPDSGCTTGTCTVKLDVAIDTTEEQLDITAVPASAPKAITFSSRLIPGLHSIRIASVFIDDPKNANAQYDRTAYVGKIRLDAAPPPTTGVQAATVVDCGATQPSSEDCTTNVLASFLPRAWRRPVSPGELAAIKAVSDSVTQNATEPGTPDAKWQTGMQLAMQAALTSPYFVYRPEYDANPTSPTPHALSDYELATRLSYFIWSSMPDDELFAKAKLGTLHQSAVLDAEVERMLDDPKAAALADDFAGQWLQTRTLATVTPSATLFPRFNQTVQAAMAQETRLFFLDFLKPGRAFPNMFDATYTFANQTLAAYYGLPDASGATSDAFVSVPLDGSHRTGLLSQGSILTSTSQPIRTSPVERGKFVLGRMLCNSPPPPPFGVPPFNTDPSAGSVRQRLEKHIEAGPACSGCHSLMDPIGLALENFDAVGEYRTVDGAYPVDTSGLTYEGKSITDVATLGQVVKSDPAFVDCVSRQLYSYAMGQQAVPGDANTIAQLEASTPSRSLRDMIHAVVKSAPFTTRGGSP